MSFEQRFRIGTLISKQFDGFVEPFRGTVKHFNAQNGVYDVDYDDGDSEQMTESMVAQALVDRQLKATYEQEQLALRNALVGRSILKLVKNYEGKEIQWWGTVMSYHPQTFAFHIEYPLHDFTEEVDFEELQTRLADQPKQPPPQSLPQQTEVDVGDSPVSPVSKKRKLLNGSVHATADDSTSNSNSGQESDGPEIVDVDAGDSDHSDRKLLFVNEKYPNRNQAYAVVRKVLRILLDQDAVKKLRSSHQLQYLTNESMRAKSSLTAFVESGGLEVLNNCLRLWFKNTTFHEGVLVVLKLLMVLPGVTPPLVVKSGIGKTLNLIAQMTRHLSFVDQRISDVAQVVIHHWKKQALQKHVTSSAKELIQCHNDVTREPIVLPLTQPRLATKDAARRDASNHLMELLRPAATTRATKATIHSDSDSHPKENDPQNQAASTTEATNEGNSAFSTKDQEAASDLADQEAFFSGKMFDLGAASARSRLEKKRRVIIEESLISRVQQQVSLASRLNQQHTETLKRANSQDQALDYDKEQEIPEGRIRFGRPNMCVFDAEEPIEKLFLNTKSTSARPASSSATSNGTASANSNSMSTSMSTSTLVRSNLSSTQPRKSILKKATTRTTEDTFW